MIICKDYDSFSIFMSKKILLRGKAILFFILADTYKLVKSVADLYNGRTTTMNEGFCNDAGTKLFIVCYSPFSLPSSRCLRILTLWRMAKCPHMHRVKDLYIPGT